MKPAPFEYLRVDTVEEAVAALAAAGGDAKILAGGQSLVPMLNFRLLRPSVLIDINRIAELATITDNGDGSLRVGALTRHRVLETSPLVARHFPVVQAAMRQVAHLAIRTRGTIGGSLAHADPAAELPMIARLLDARIHTIAPGGTRAIEAADFFVGSLTTALADDELIVRVDLPALPDATGWGFAEFARRAGDYALAAVGVLMRLRQDRIEFARVAMMGVDDTPIRCPEAEAALRGQAPGEALFADVAAAATAALTPNSDLHASADYRRALAAALMERALSDAWRRARGESR